MKALALSLATVMVGSEYYELPIYVCKYLGLLGYTLPPPLVILDNILTITMKCIIFVMFLSLSNLKTTKKNVLILVLGPFLTAPFLLWINQLYLGRLIGQIVLLAIIFWGDQNITIPKLAPINVKDYYVKGEHYDWVSDPRRLEKIFHSKREKETVKFINKYAMNSNVLDVGCGTGRITRKLTGNVLGIDINEWNLDRARENAPNARFMLSDCESMDEIPSCSKDLVVFTETLEHLGNPHRALEEVRRVLNFGGIAVITVPSRSWIWHFRKYLTTTHPHSEPFHHNYSKHELIELLKIHFQILEIAKIVYGLTWIAVVKK